MSTEDVAKSEPTTGKEPYPRLMVSYAPGRWGKIFHILDAEGKEITLSQKDALKLARTILKEQNK